MLLRHPLTLLTREVPAIDLRPGATWLLLQDVHAPFTDPEDGALARLARRKVVGREFDEYFDTLQVVVPNFGRLLSGARAGGLGIVYACLGHEASAPASPFQRALGWDWDITGPDGVFPAAWRPAEGDRVYAKPGWGALGNPAFARFLDDQRVENLLIAGTMFDFGVRQTCYELADRGVGSLVIADAVVPLSLAGQAHTAGNLAHGLTKLRSTAETLDLLQVMADLGTVLV